MTELPLKEHFHQVWKRRKVVALFVACVAVLVTLFTLRQTKIYRAVTTVEIGAETPDAAFFEEVTSATSQNWWSAMRYYETQYQIIQSRDLLSRAAKRGVEAGVIRGMTEEQATGFLQGGVSVRGDENSRIASIFFDDSDPRRAQAVSILISQVYVDENLGRKLRGVEEAVSWLNERLKEVREEKAVREAELQKKQQEYRMVSIDDQGNSAKANLKALTEDLNRLKSTRLETEAKYRKLSDLVEKSDKIEDLFGVVSSDLLTKIKQDLTELKTDRSRLAQKYLDRHPEMQKVDSQIAELNRLIRQEVSNEVSRLKTKYLLAKAEEDSLARAVEEQKVEAIKIEQITRDVADVAMMTNANQQVFETLLRKIREADLSALVRSNNIRIVDRALTPGSPIRPDLRKNLALALLVGLIGGIGLALLLENIDDTIKSHEDIERYLNYSVLALIPHLETDAEKNGMPPEIADAELAFVPIKHPTSVVSEFYRSLRTNVLFLTRATPGNRLLFASTGPGEGKTVTALNLAATLSQLDRKVVLVDLDFRRPKIHRIFPGAKGVGVTNVILGELSLKDAIQRSAYEGFDYLSAGAIPPNPAELLSSNELRDMLDYLSSHYDHVILDSSPIAPVTDATIISQYVHGVVMVVRCGKTHRKAVMLANQQLRKVSNNVLGVVLNDVQIKDASYGSYQYYRYGYSPYESEGGLSQATAGPASPPVAPADPTSH